MATGRTPAEKRAFAVMLENSFKKYSEFEGPVFGVTMSNNIIPDGATDDIEELDVDYIPAPQRLNKAPFDGVNVPVNIYRSWLIEPPTFLPKLMEKLRSQNVAFVTKAFQADDANGTVSQGVRALNEKIVFNCMGLGAKHLVHDDNLYPIRGRLIHMKPNPELNYMLLLAQGYMFCRRDVIVLGGTFDQKQSDLSFDQKQYDQIMHVNRSFFVLPGNGIARRGIPYMPIVYRT